MRHTTTYTKESAAWQAIADVLESGEMPVYNQCYDRCAGLCSIVARLYAEGHISLRLRRVMGHRIHADLSRLGLDSYGPFRVVGERLEVARRFEKESEK